MDIGTFPDDLLAAAGAGTWKRVPLDLLPGSYVTDERRLLRCLTIDASPEPFASAVFEDCMSLEVVIIPVAEIDGDSLRVVRR